jgi:type I restriction enzyme M protein
MAKKVNKKQKQPKSISSAKSLSSFVKSICDIMRRSNCASALQYVPELTWILFLRILDAQEEREQETSEALGNQYSPALVSPYRWQDWAAPYSDKPEHPKTSDGKPLGWKRHELFASGDGKLFNFINNELLPYMHSLDQKIDGTQNSEASPKQRVIGRIMTAVEKVRVDSETNLRDILDMVHEISIDHINDQHFFTLSQVYEDLLLKMGEKNSDGGQFFTPREVIRAMVHTIDPNPGESVYDPCCGTGGFLAVAYEHLNRNLGDSPASTTLDQLKHETFFGREKENLVFPIALANLILHGIDQPNLWHGNTLTKKPTYDALFKSAPSTFDVILTNPPFGGKEGKDAQKNYSFETSATQVLFLQHILSELSEPLDGKSGGRCGIVLDEGLLFRTNETAFVETKRKLTDECDLWCIVSLPVGVFTTAGAGVKTNLLFFTKGKKTEKIWYYDLSQVQVGKKTPMTLAHFGFGANGEILDDRVLPATLTSDWAENEENKGMPFPSFARLLSAHGTPESESAYSWTLDFEARKVKAREEMAPYLQRAAQLKEEIIALKEMLKDFKKAKTEDFVIKDLTEKIVALEKSARAEQVKADDIDAAIYDLKAVNPNAVKWVDLRTPDEIICFIKSYSQIIHDSISKLEMLISQE